MAENTSSIDKLYSEYSSGFLEKINSDDFFAFFMNAIQAGRSNISLYEKYIERNIDVTWVEAIEKTIVPLDTIIRNPNRFIKNEEEVVPIEMARHITTDSLRHLAQHTNMIAKVEGDEVTPQRILNVTKEESFETYENRFIYTLLMKVEYFLDKRLQELLKGINSADEFELKLNGTCDVGHDKLSYDINISYMTPHVDLSFDEMLIQADTSKMSSMQRIERIRKIIYSFMGSALIKSLSGCAIVRPPLNMTNVLTKNQNFIKAVDLWVFIDTYDSEGFSMDFVERETVPSDKFIKELFSTVGMQYTVVKANTGHTADVGDYEERAEVVSPNVVRRDVDNLIENYELEIDEVRRVFLERVEKKKREKRVKYAQIREVIDRAIAFEQEKIDLEDKQRKAREEKERKALEAARKREEQRILREKERELKEKEKAKKKAEKIRQQKLLAKEKEKQKLKKEKERAKAQAAALKAKEKQKADAAAKKEKEKLQKLKAAQKASEAARIAKEKERAQREKIKQKAADEARRLKEKERAEREKAKLKEQVALRAQKEKERAAKEKAKLKEQEMLRRQKEKERLAKIKEKEREAERKKKEREKERLKAQKEKAREAEKQKKNRIEKQKELDLVEKMLEEEFKKNNNS